MSIATSARIAVGVLALTIAAPMQAQQSAVTVPRAVLERYVGEYVYPAGNTIMVGLRGDTLIRDVGGHMSVYTPISETRFRMGVFVHEFVIDQAGGVTCILRGDGGVEIRITRRAPGAAATPATPATSSAPAAAAVRVPTSVLARYVGEYQLTAEVTAMVLLKGDTLIREIRGQQQIFTPISETRFKLGGAEAEFVIDQAGGVTMVVRNGTEERRYPRKPKT